MNFTEVEQAVRQLRMQLEEGTLTRAEVDQRLKELMIQDEDGDWWMIGFDSGSWYRHVEGRWVVAEPPRESPAAPPMPVYRPTEPEAPQTYPQEVLASGRMNPWVAFFLGLVLGVGSSAIVIPTPTPQVVEKVVEKPVVETVVVEKEVEVEVTRVVEVEVEKEVEVEVTRVVEVEVLVEVVVTATPTP